MKASLLFPLFLILIIVACKRPSEAINHSSLWNESISPSINKARFSDTIPARFLSGINVSEVNGIKASYASGRSTCYFKYKSSDPKKVLAMISSLPFKRTNAITDTTCRIMPNTFSLSGRSILPKNEVDAAEFFWHIDPADYDYYECVKTPVRHTILINRKTKQVLHRMETMS